MHRVYNLLVRLAVPVAFSILLARAMRDRAYRTGLAERFGLGPRLPAQARIWLHAVSLGEVTASAAIVRALRARHPQAAMLITTATPTGRARAISLFGGSVDVRYLPYDLPGAVERFLERVNPRLGIIMETELWPNLYRECARRGMPLLLANARLSTRSVSRYLRFGDVFRPLFAPNLTIAAQTSADAQRFAAIGADPLRTRVAGNVKFDIDVGKTVIERGLALRTEILGARSVWIAGSTHQGEDEPVLDAHAAVCANEPGALLILVPRHPQRFEAVAALIARRGLSFVRRSGGKPVPAEAQVLLLDSVGELLDFYAAADVAFVGGSLVPIGGHNLLEPAACGLPVLLGPSDFNGREIAALLLRLGAAIRIADGAGLGLAVSRLLADGDERRRIGAIGRGAVEANRGSTEQVLELIDAQWPTEVPT